MVLQQNEMKHRLFLKIATVVLVYHEKLEQLHLQYLKAGFLFQIFFIILLYALFGEMYLLSCLEKIVNKYEKSSWNNGSFDANHCHQPASQQKILSGFSSFQVFFLGQYLHPKLVDCKFLKNVKCILCSVCLRIQVCLFITVESRISYSRLLQILSLWILNTLKALQKIPSNGDIQNWQKCLPAPAVL